MALPFPRQLPCSRCGSPYCLGLTACSTPYSVGYWYELATRVPDVKKPDSPETIKLRELLNNRKRFNSLRF